MHLERIELIGFKSFAERTVFDFHPGITAIVGPNGCGKSNVVDAFKWVLGEQSAKSLRGGSMENVIFFGSASRKTRGMAEVTLMLSGINVRPPNFSEEINESGADEIALTRRLYKSGESEYLINKVPCRLKDIKNIFLDTGLEIKAYSILEQGRMNDILSSKPVDRRFLIEEVAGVMKYKIRKAEALQKLEASKSNLQRLQDIIAEVKRQINSIDRHAKKAERYKKLFEEIKCIDIKIAARDIRILNEEVNKLTSLENALKTKEAGVSAKLRSSEALIQEKKRECLEKEKELEMLRVKLHESERLVTEGEGKIALLKMDYENLRGKVQGLHVRDGELTVEKESAVAQLKRIDGEITDNGHRLSVFEMNMEDKNRVFSELDKEIADYEQCLEERRMQLFNEAEGISTLKNEIKHLSQIIEEIGRKMKKGSDDMDIVKDKISDLGSEIAGITDECLKSESELTAKIKTREEVSAELEGKKHELGITEKALYRDREELAAMSSKLDSLKELDASQKSEFGEKINVLCQIADILETPPEYEAAIEAVLQDKLSAVIVDDCQEITKALQHIKEHNSKRCGFISVNPVRRSEQGFLSNRGFPDSRGGDDGQLSDGVIGNALRFITVKDGFDSVAEALLSDVLLIENIEKALSLWQMNVTGEYSRPAYFVTLDGEVLEPSGLVSGGVEKGVLKIRRQLKELENDIALKKEHVLKNEDSIAVLKNDIKSAGDSIASLNDDITNSEKRCHELKLRIMTIEEEKGRQLKKLEFLVVEMDNEKKEEEDLKALMNEKELKYHELNTQKEDIEQEIRSLQNAITEGKESLEVVRSELTEIKLSITAIREKVVSLKKEKERLTSAISDIEGKKAEMLNERLGIEKDISFKEEEVGRKEQSLKSDIVSIKNLQTQVSKVNEVLEAKAAELASLEEEGMPLFSELETVRRELNQAEMKKMESSMKLNYIKEDIKKTYSVEITTSDKPVEVTSEEEEKLPLLKEKLQEMGPVSLGTLEEFEELKTRYDFLTSQQEDLLNSITSLDETIQKINRSTQKRLTEAFEALNEKFKEVFKTLFGDGRAELLLTEGNILESGIEIVAQPPGKRLKNLMALSGGEQALTALSLLFAGFMIKPTPMCILDEVDAPLDESNTERFVKMLSGLSRNIQFITITHNRITMESADYIYGVTMEEPGVSKVISMHMAEAAHDLERVESRE